MPGHGKPPTETWHDALLGYMGGDPVARAHAEAGCEGVADFCTAEKADQDDVALRPAPSASIHTSPLVLQDRRPCLCDSDDHNLPESYGHN